MKNTNIVTIFLLSIAIMGFGQSKSNTTIDTKKSIATNNAVNSKTTTNVSKSSNPKVAPTNPMLPKDTKLQESIDIPTISPPYSKFSTTLELNANPTKSINNYNIINLIGQLALNFHVSRKFAFGPYFDNKIVSTHNYETPTVDYKMVQMASFKLYGMGLQTTFILNPNSKVQLIPELRVGYNTYNIEATNFDSVNTAFIDHQYVNITPRINIGFKLSEYTLMGFNGGYTIPLYIKGGINDAYDPHSPVFGLFVRFSLPN